MNNIQKIAAVLIILAVVFAGISIYLNITGSSIDVAQGVSGAVFNNNAGGGQVGLVVEPPAGGAG